MTTRTASGPSIAYVQGSRVTVRSQPSVVAPVVGHLTTNAQTDVVERGAEWCRIRSTSTASLSGFIACRFLGDAPLTLEQIDARLAEAKLPQRERLDWNMRRFWAAPSLRQLEAVGYQMEQTFLSDDTRHKEMLFGTTLRPPNAEFDAMKARLAAGTNPASVDSRLPQRRDEYYDELPLQQFLKRRSLPPATPSFFRLDEPLFVLPLRPFTLREHGHSGVMLADALSTVQGVPHRTRIAAPADMAHSGRVGVWDISAVSVTFDKPVAMHGVTERGELTSLSFTSIIAPIGETVCTGGGMRFVAKTGSARWSTAILGWVGKPASVAASRVITTRTTGGQYERVTQQTVDLNGDDVPDFLVLAGLFPAVVEPGDIIWKAVFANVGGKWVLAGFAQGLDCT